MQALQQGKVIPWQEVVDPTTYQMFVKFIFVALKLITEFSLFFTDITTTTKRTPHNGSDLKRWVQHLWPLVNRAYILLFVDEFLFYIFLRLVWTRQGWLDGGSDVC